MTFASMTHFRVYFAAPLSSVIVKTDCETDGSFAALVVRVGVAGHWPDDRRP